MEIIIDKGEEDEDSAEEEVEEDLAEEGIMKMEAEEEEGEAGAAEEDLEETIEIIMKEVDLAEITEKIIIMKGLMEVESGNGATAIRIITITLEEGEMAAVEEAAGEAAEETMTPETMIMVVAVKNCNPGELAATAIGVKKVIIITMTTIIKIHGAPMTIIAIKKINGVLLKKRVVIRAHGVMEIMRIMVIIINRGEVLRKVAMGVGRMETKMPKTITIIKVPGEILVIKTTAGIIITIMKIKAKQATEINGETIRIKTILLIKINGGKTTIVVKKQIVAGDLIERTTLLSIQPHKRR
jgi:hypothetical protein